MATFTVTTAVNIDTLAAKAGSDTYNINGGYLTVDQHTRYGVNQNTSAAMGNITLSATLGGTIEFNSTLVRLIAYNTGTGNVPALDTAITKGGASGKLLGVYSALNAAPTAAGNAMPASGYILVRQWNLVAYSTGVLTGIGATATAADVAGWLEIVGVDALTTTVNRLNTFKVRGGWYEFLGVTTDGNRATTYQVPSNGAIVYLPGVEVETGTGTGVYEFYPCAGSATALVANMATDAVRGRWCWISTAGLVRFGHDGTNSTGGYVPPAGRKIRIPNIFFMCCTAAAPTANVIPNATLTTRMEFATTGGGVLDIDKACINWYCNWSQPYSVALTNAYIMSAVLLQECASAIAWSNVGVGQEAAVTQNTLTMGTLLATGNTMDKCTWTRAAQAASGTYVTTWSGCQNFTITNERIHSLTKAGNATSGSMSLTRVSNTSWTSTLLGGGRVFMTGCFDVRFTTTTYYDNINGSTATTIPMYVWDLGTAPSYRLLFDGLSFGGLNLVQPYSGILNFGVAGCSYVRLRNLGTAASPLSMGGALVKDVAWTRATTTMTVTSVAHGLKAGDIFDLRIMSDTSVLAVTNSAATVRTVLAAPTADTFTVTVANAGAASGTLSYAVCMASQLVVFAAGATANNVKVQRCYVSRLRTGIGTTDNSSKNVVYENVYTSDWAAFLSPMLNFYARGLQSTMALTAQTSCYGTHFVDFYTTETTANVSGVSWTRATTTATVTSTDHGLKTGDVIVVTVTSSAAAIVLGQKTVTATTSSAFTFTCLNAGSASGTLTFTVLNGRVAVQMNEATTDTASQVVLANGAAFTSAGSLYMPTIGQQATFIADKNVRGHSSFPIAEAVMAGGTIGNYDITYSLDGGANYYNLYYTRAGGGGSNGSTNVTMTSTTGVVAGDYVWGTNIAPNAKVLSVTNATTVVVDNANIGVVSGVLRFNHLPSEAVSSALTGFPLRIRITTSTTNATAITSLYFFTNSTSAARAATYPMDLVTLTATIKNAADSVAIEGARVYIIAAAGGPEAEGTVLLNALTNASGIASTTTYEYLGDQPVTGRVRKSTSAPLFKTAPLSGTITADGLSLTAFMVADQ